MTQRPESVIDLGVYQFDPDASDDLGPEIHRGGWGLEWRRLRQVPSRLRQVLARLRRVPPRWWLAALLAPVLLATLESAPRQSSLVPLWEAPGQLVASGDIAYAITRVDGVPVLTAYQVADGAVGWEQPLPAGDWAMPDLLGDLLLVRRHDGQGTAWVVAIDAGTGRVRWQRAGRHAVPVAEDRLLLADSDTVTGLRTEGLPGWEAAPYEVTAVDPWTGDRAWTGRFNPGEVPLAHATHLLTMQPSGRLTRYDLDTGAVLAVAETSPVPDAVVNEPGQVTTVVTLDGTVMAVSGARLPVATAVADQVIVGDRFGVAAYDAATLRPRWRVEDPGDGWTATCGTLICDYRSTTSILRGVDPATGAVRWSRSCQQDVPAASDGVAVLDHCGLLPPDSPEAPMLRRLTRSGPDTVWSLITVDETTGELGAALTGWWPTGLRKGDRALMVSDSWSEREEGPRVWLGWWRAEPPELELLAPVDAERCHHLTGAYLLCGSEDPDTGDLRGARVWRVGAG